MADLTEFSPSSDVIVVELKSPKDQEVLTNDDDNSVMTWTLHAPHTKQYKKVMYDYTQSRIDRMRTEDGKLDSTKVTIEQAEEENLAQLVDVTKEWNITYKGEKPKFSKKVAKEILEKLFWIKPQLEEALETYEVFTKS